MFDHPDAKMFPVSTILSNPCMPEQTLIRFRSAQSLWAFYGWDNGYHVKKQANNVGVWTVHELLEVITVPYKPPSRLTPDLSPRLCCFSSGLPWDNHKAVVLVDHSSRTFCSAGVRASCFWMIESWNRNHTAMIPTWGITITRTCPLYVSALTPSELAERRTSAAHSSQVWLLECLEVYKTEWIWMHARSPNKFARISHNSDVTPSYFIIVRSYAHPWSISLIWLRFHSYQKVMSTILTHCYMNDAS